MRAPRRARRPARYRLVEGAMLTDDDVRPVPGRRPGAVGFEPTTCSFRESLCRCARGTDGFPQVLRCTHEAPGARSGRSRTAPWPRSWSCWAPNGGESIGSGTGTGFPGGPITGGGGPMGLAKLSSVSMPAARPCRPGTGSPGRRSTPGSSGSRKGPVQLRRPHVELLEVLVTGKAASFSRARVGVVTGGVSTPAQN